MSLGLSQIPSLQDHNSNTPLRQLAKLEHLIPPPNSFFMPTDHHHHDHAANNQQGFHQDQYINKPLLHDHGLMQLPDLQCNTANNHPTSANLFNLGFFSSNSGAASSISTTENTFGGQGSTAVFTAANMAGSGLSSIYSNSMQHENSSTSPHMSATALLQNAAQLGSTTSSNIVNNSTSLLRGLGNSSSNGSKYGDHHETLIRISQMESTDSNLQGLMNSLANGNSSNIFGRGQDPNFGGFGRNLSAGIGAGNDKLTLDFLGVGGMVRNNINGGMNIDQRSQAQAASQLLGSTAKLV